MLAIMRDPHPPGAAADLAVLNETAREIRLDIDLHVLPAIGTGYEKLVFHDPSVDARIFAELSCM